MSLTTAQYQALRNDVAANTNAPGGSSVYASTPINQIPNNSDGNDAIAAYYNGLTAPAFVVWRTSVSIGDVGKTFNANDLAGLSSLNTQRLQNLASWLSSGVNPSLASVRQFFDDIFSGAGGSATRTALLALWKRSARRVETLFATGTGSDAVPATLVVEGTVASRDIEMARNS